MNMKGWNGAEFRLMKTEQVDGIICRIGTMDAYFVKEVVGSYGWMNVQDQVVMDIGANIGCYAVQAQRRGCEQIICYEPHPVNFKLLKLNSPKSKNIQAGLVLKKETGVLYASQDQRNQGSFTKYPMRGRLVCGVDIEFLSFAEELEKYRPSVLKIDCERAEHEFLVEPLPEFVKQVAIEIHFGRKEWLKSAARIVKLFKGWEVVRKPVVQKGRWHTLAGWRR